MIKGCDSAYLKGVKKIIDREINTGRILDIGCGSGENYKLLKGPNKEVYVLDITDLRTEDHGLFVRGNGCALPFKSESFDTVVSFDVIEHVDDDKRFISEAVRVTKKKGKIILGSPNLERLSNRIRAIIGKEITFPKSYGLDPVLGEILHLREYTCSGFREAITSASLHDLQVRLEGILLGVYLIGSKGQGIVTVPALLTRYAHHLLAIIKIK